MVINSKQKGARFERKLASMLRGYGYDCRRGQQFCGANGDADVIGLPGLHIEAKHQEKMHLYTWMGQAVRDSRKTGKFPAVFHKKNNADVLVTMRFGDFMEIYREWEAGQNWTETEGAKDDHKTTTVQCVENGKNDSGRG